MRQQLLGLAMTASLVSACGESNFAGSGEKVPPKPAKTSAPAGAKEDVPLGNTAAAGDANAVPNSNTSSNPASSSSSNSSSSNSAASSNASAGSNFPPAPDDAKVLGSFKLWTEPSDPKPYEAYQIIVEVTLPSGVTNYDRSDLSGEIKGTEGWFNWQLGSDKYKPSQFQVSGNKARLGTWIPGDDAVEGYGDIITVKSKLLSETQSTKVDF